MKIKLIAVGSRMPAWIETGFLDYQKRLPTNYALELIEINLPKRHKQANIQNLMAIEAKAMLKAVASDDLLIGLDQTGQSISSEKLAASLKQFHDQNQNICLFIGGPDGIHADCLKKCHHIWSLSALTLPHPLVRLIVAEQIYRAFSIINHHPYHR